MADLTDEIWDYLKGSDGSVTYHDGPPKDLKKKRGFADGVYYGRDGKEYHRKKPLAFLNENQRRFIMATRRGAGTDPQFSSDSAHDFIHEARGNTKL